MQDVRLAPQWAQKILSRFGTNQYGQPLYRIVWGPSETKIIGGYWMDSGKSEYRRVPRYGKDPKWVLERWQPAHEIGTPEQWESMTSTPDGFFSIGPFPAHGRYLHATTFSIGKGISGYVPLEPGMVELAARAVWMGRIFTRWEIAVEMREAELSKEREQDERFDREWDERQLSREGLSIGRGGAFNKQAEIDDYARKIERAGVFVDARKFKPGLKQQ